MSADHEQPAHTIAAPNTLSDNTQPFLALVLIFLSGAR